MVALKLRRKYLKSLKLESIICRAHSMLNLVSLKDLIPLLALTQGIHHPKSTSMNVVYKFMEVDFINHKMFS